MGPAVAGAAAGGVFALFLLSAAVIVGRRMRAARLAGVQGQSSANFHQLADGTANPKYATQQPAGPPI